MVPFVLVYTHLGLTILSRWLPTLQQGISVHTIYTSEIGYKVR